MSNKRKFEEGEVQEAKRLDLDIEALLFSVLPIILENTNDLIYIRQVLACVSKTLRDEIAKLRKLTFQQEKILALLMEPPSMEGIHQYREVIHPKYRITTPPGTGKTTLMLLAALKISHREKRLVAIVSNTELHRAYEKKLYELATNYKLGHPNILRPSKLINFPLAKYTKPAVCLIGFTQFSDKIILELRRLCTYAIFTDDYVGKMYPTFVCDVQRFWPPRKMELPRFMAITASVDSVVQSAQIDNQLQLPNVTIHFKLINQCGVCVHGNCTKKIPPEINLSIIPFLRKHLAGKKKILILHNPCHRIPKYERDKVFENYFTELTRAAGLPPMRHYHAASNVAFAIEDFERATEATLALPWASNVIRGHNIRPDAAIVFNGRRNHNFPDHSMDMPLNPEQMLQVLGRIRRPDNRNQEIPVCVIDFHKEVASTIDGLLIGMSIGYLKKRTTGLFIPESFKEIQEGEYTRLP
jgi:hypothetical protein